MIKKIQTRFVLFTILVISLTLGLVTIAILVNNKNAQTYHRTIIAVILMMALVVVSSIVFSFVAMKPIKKSWQRQLDFTADASHELRTPLAIIQSNLEIVLDNPDELVKSQDKWLNNILNETNRLSKLVDDLLTLSRADSNEVQLSMTELSLNCIIEERISAFNSLADERGIKLESSVAPETVIYGDEKRMTQLFTILLDNSIKYMGKAGTIKIEAFPLNKHVQIIFSDNGIGIPTEDIQKVFTRFYRVDKARARNQGGSGLGLAIAKWIVEAHNGKIILKSGDNKGVVYKITI